MEILLIRAKHETKYTVSCKSCGHTGLRSYHNGFHTFTPTYESGQIRVLKHERYDNIVGRIWFSDPDDVPDFYTCHVCNAITYCNYCDGGNEYYGCHNCSFNGMIERRYNVKQLRG